MRARALLCLLLTAVTGCQQSAAPSTKMQYPQTRKGDVVDDYGGTKVADPYRWMEDLDAKEVADWVAAQNAVTDPYLEALPLRGALNKRLTELWNYPRIGCRRSRADNIFYAKNTGLQRQAPIFMRASIDGRRRW